MSAAERARCTAVAEGVDAPGVGLRDRVGLRAALLARAD